MMDLHSDPQASSHTLRPLGRQPASQSLQDELSRSLSDALDQLERLGHQPGRRARLAQRRAQACLESALVTTESLFADLDEKKPGPQLQAVPPLSRTAPLSYEHEITRALKHRLQELSGSLSRTPELHTLGPLPELPRIVMRSIVDAMAHLLCNLGALVGSVEITPKPHGLQLRLVAAPELDPMADTTSIVMRADRGRVATLLATVGARLDHPRGPATQTLAVVSWPARSDEG